GSDLRGLDLARTRRRLHYQSIEKLSRRLGDRGSVESLSVRPRRPREVAQPADELQRRPPDLFLRHRRLEVVQRLGITTHRHHFSTYRNTSGGWPRRTWRPVSSYLRPVARPDSATITSHPTVTFREH